MITFVILSIGNVGIKTYTGSLPLLWRRDLPYATQPEVLWQGSRRREFRFSAISEIRGTLYQQVVIVLRWKCLNFKASFTTGLGDPQAVS